MTLGQHCWMQVPAMQGTSTSDFFEVAELLSCRPAPERHVEVDDDQCGVHAWHMSMHCMQVVVNQLVCWFMLAPTSLTRTVSNSEPQVETVMVWLRGGVYVYTMSGALPCSTGGCRQPRLSCTLGPHALACLRRWRAMTKVSCCKVITAVARLGECCCALLLTTSWLCPAALVSIRKL
jgi:hypothetical protein